MQNPRVSARDRLTRRIALLGMTFVATQAGCGGGGGGGGSLGPTISGVAYRGGPVSGATVVVQPVGPNGAIVPGGASAPDVLGSATTGADGAFSVPLHSSPSGPLIVFVLGGTYVSPWDGTTVPGPTARTCHLLDSAAAAGPVVVTPLSHIVAARALDQLASGSALALAHATGLEFVRALYGFQGPSDVAIERTVPTFSAAAVGADAFLAGFVLGCMDRLALAESPSDRNALVQALASDASDGVLDGKAGGIPVTLGAGTLPFTAGTSDFLAALADYAKQGKNVVDEGLSLATLDPTLVSLRRSLSFGAATPGTAGLSAGSSGSIATASFGGKQWLYVAARTKGIVAIDITDPETDTPEMKVWSQLYTTTFSNAAVDGVVSLGGADHPQLFVHTYATKHFALVNAETGAVEGEGDLPLVGGPVGFSGGSAYVAGAIADAGRDGVWLATTDGYGFFRRSTAQWDPTLLFTITPPYRLAENFGADIAHDLLWAPNYGGSASGFPFVAGGIQLIDLGTKTSSYMDDVQYQATLRANGLFDPDAGAVDTSYRVGIVTQEDSPDVGFVRLSTVSKISGDGSIGLTGLDRFAAAPGGTAHVRLAAPGLFLSGAAVDSETHLVLFMAGVFTDIAVGELQDPASVPPGGTWSGLTDWRFVTSLVGYQLAGDPHAVASIRCNATGKAYGYLLSGLFGVSVHQIDLRRLLDAAPAGATGDDAHRVTSDLEAAKIHRIWTIP